jgi:thiamine biosynthesis protein ThiS
VSALPPSAPPAELPLTVNGRERGVAAGTTVAGLVAELAPDARLVAVERNGEIVPRGRWAEVALAAGDRLEIVRFVQGG